MEVNFQLDSDGRTSSAIANSASCNGLQEQSLDYACKAVYSGLSKELSVASETFREKVIDDLIFDCEILDFSILPRTFWIPATGVVCYSFEYVSFILSCDLQLTIMAPFIQASMSYRAMRVRNISPTCPRRLQLRY